MLQKIGVFFIASLLCIKQVNAQTILAPGDMLFTSFNTVPGAGVAPDSFSLVILAPITANTVIYFTDRGYQGGTTWQAAGTTEGTIAWNVGAALAIGQEVRIVGYGANAATVGGVVNGTVTQVAGGNAVTGLSLATIGDQIMAFQGAAGDPTSSSATFICGINWQFNCGTSTDAGWNGSGCSYGPSSSQMPPGLTGGVNAFLTSNLATYSNGYTSQGRFECTNAPFANVAALKTALMSRSNWTYSTNTTVTEIRTPAGCTFFQVTTTWNGSTWSNGTPTATANAVIASSTSPASFSCNTLTINSGFSLNTTGITATVYDNIVNNGNGFSGTGTVSIADVCTLSGNACTFGGTLNLVAGTFATGNLLTIAPGGAITGAYANLSGSVSLQQSIIGQRGWRILANPFTNAQTISTLASNNGITINTTAQASGLTDARFFSNAVNAWSNVTGTTLSANTTYAIFIRGLASEVSGSNYTAGPTAFTYKTSGTLNGASINFVPINTGNFMVVGNPYAAPVKTSALTNGTGVPYYVYNIVQGGTQTLRRTKAGSWSAVLSSATSTTIPVLGAIAYKPSSTSSYAITAAADINTGGAVQANLFRQQEAAIPHLELQVGQEGMLMDKLFVRLDANASNLGTDGNDLEKFYNDNLNLYTKSIDNKYLGIDARAILDTVTVGINALPGSYVFRVEANSFPAGYTAYLVDHLLHTRTKLEEGSTYPFNITTEANSKGEERFVLEFSKAPAIILPQAFEVKVLGNIISGNTVRLQIAGSHEPVCVTITDLLGRKVTMINGLTNGTTHIGIGHILPGMYLLQANNGKASILEKFIKQ